MISIAQIPTSTNAVERRANAMSTIVPADMLQNHLVTLLVALVGNAVTLLIEILVVT
jgi:hypothetical protein